MYMRAMGQAVSLMLCDRPKEKMPLVGLEPTLSAIRADVLPVRLEKTS